MIDKVSDKEFKILVNEYIPISSKMLDRLRDIALNREKPSMASDRYIYKTHESSGHIPIESSMKAWDTCQWKVLIQ